MLFNSIDFLIFLPIIFFLYWYVFNKKLRIQNTLILVSSYIFYGWWDWRFLSLIFLSTVIDFIIGLKIYNSSIRKEQNFYLFFSIIFNLSLLGFFKYYNFFIDSWIDLLNVFGYNNQDIWTLSIILPVGISFYTFQTMSYSLDIYFKKLKPTKDFISFAAFVSFFPQLVAGPIERASNLIPQILSNRQFEYKRGLEGLRLILWGMFKKVVIADSLAFYVDDIFYNYLNFNGGVLLLGLIYFSFQIYCDFSGYSDIAIGLGKLFGVELMSNFRFPYFSRDISEFWRRWHISLSTWFRDYLYIPLGGSKDSKSLALRNIFLIFTISGLWHGANWTFIMWGFLHAVMYIPLFLLDKNREYTTSVVAKRRMFPSFKEFFQMLSTFFMTMIAWVFFRSESVSDAFSYLIILFTNFTIPNSNRSGLIFVLILIIFEWIFRKDERNPLCFKNQIIRYFIYLVISYFIFAHFQIVDVSNFIYFQF